MPDLDLAAIQQRAEDLAKLGAKTFAEETAYNDLMALCQEVEELRAKLCAENTEHGWTEVGKYAAEQAVERVRELLDELDAYGGGRVRISLVRRALDGEENNDA